MDALVAEEFPMEKNPNLEIAQLKFLLTLPEYENDEEKRLELIQFITSNDMAPYYQMVCEEMNWKVDMQLLQEMQESNKVALEKFEEEIEYATDNLGKIDIKEAYLNKANYSTKIGDKENALGALSRAYTNTVALGCKIDNLFHTIRLGLFFNDGELVNTNLERVESLLEEGANWYMRNCFKIYKGLYSLSIRDFKTATETLVSSISTFVCTELISLSQFIKYTVFSAMLILSRKELKTEIIDCSDMLQALHYDETLKDYVFSLYDCEYKAFFLNLSNIETILREDMFLHAHYKFYVREMKIKAYDQLLSTYISVSLQYMAEQFGVSEEYIENDLYKMISAKRLNYRIDKVNEKVVNSRSEETNDMFNNVLKQGDLLLNKIQKLSRVITV